MNVRLTEKHLIKLAAFTNTSLEKITELHAMDLLDSNRVLEMLVKRDWQTLAHQAEKYSYYQRLMAIAKEYNISSNLVRECIRYKPRKGEYFCDICGASITNIEYKRNEGLCEKCKIESINL